MIAWLEKNHGEGTLEDSDGMSLLPEDEDVLKAGTYNFTLTSSPQGESNNGLV